MANSIENWRPAPKPAIWWSADGRAQRELDVVDRRVDLQSRLELAKAEVAAARVAAKAMVAASVMDSACRLVDYGRFLSQEDPVKGAITDTIAADFAIDQRRELFWSWNR
jgi:hypothetical protein